MLYRQTRMPGNQERPYGKSRQAPPLPPRCRKTATASICLWRNFPPRAGLFPGRRNACRARGTHQRKRQGDVRQKVAGKRDAAPFPSDEEITSYPRQEGVPYGSGHDISEKFTGRRPSCQSALVMGRKLYSVKIKLDVATGTERLQRQIQEDVRCKDHTPAEREIVPALYRDRPEIGEITQPADAISDVRLGVLRGNVKPPGPKRTERPRFFRETTGRRMRDAKRCRRKRLWTKGRE